MPISGYVIILRAQKMIWLSGWAAIIFMYCKKVKTLVNVCSIVLKALLIKALRKQSSLQVIFLKFQKISLIMHLNALNIRMRLSVLHMMVVITFWGLIKNRMLHRFLRIFPGVQTLFMRKHSGKLRHISCSILF